ncbi:MAG TPA: LytR family transcriptional regulator [Firmicutes bacterium]|nr:LytR family transcriptional regulator [Bacillota bacterium]
MLKLWQKVLFGFFAALVIGGSVGAVYINSKLDEVFVSSVDDELDSDVDLNINENLVVNDGNTLNVALFGLDCRTTDYSGCRSDAMMILSYKPTTNEVLVTSVQRDTYVEIMDHGYDKINHSYAYGGAALAIQTLNRSFDLDISQYITVDFWAVEKVIDAVGGITVEVDDEEFLYINKYVKELNNKSPDDTKSELLAQAGSQLLNGRQAVAYMRIRYTANGDFGRMGRQREVMELALDQMKNLSLTQMLKVVDELLPTIKTNLPKSEVVAMLTNVVTKGVPTMSQNQMPSNEAGVGQMIDGIYYYLPNTLLDNVQDLHDKIYGDQVYTANDTVVEMSQYIESLLGN